MESLNLKNFLRGDIPFMHHNYYGSIKKEINLYGRIDIGQIKLYKPKKAFKQKQLSSNDSDINKNKLKQTIKFDLIGEIFSEKIGISSVKLNCLQMME